MVPSRAALAVALTLALASSARAAEPPELLIDAIAPFFDPERPPPRSWAMPFSQMDTTEPPYVAEAHLERALGRFERYCENARGLGYTGAIVGNLIHLANFGALAGGTPGLGPVYGAESPFRRRHQAYKAIFRRAAEIAHAKGLTLVVETDFPAFTPDLRRWLEGAGEPAFSAKNPRLIAAYRAAIEELFEDVGADALSVRFGEGGGAYDEPATGYASTVAVRSVEDARIVVGALLEAVEAHNARTGGKRRLLVRTWTIGLGPLGNLHTDPALYERVFAPFYGRETLRTVVKHVAMDFYDFVPPNPTIGVGGLRQIVELQARREYEGFGLFPNFRAREVSGHLARFRDRPQFAGVSVWPANGGFLMDRPIYYRCAGPDDWIDANVYAYARLVREPGADPGDLGRDWARERAGLGAADAEKVARVLAHSPGAVRRAMYVSAFARSPPPLFGLDHAPTMLWVFWTRPIGAYGVQALIHRSVREDPEGVEGAIEEGERALRDVDQMLAIAGTLSETPFKARLLGSLRYERSIFKVLAEYRRFFLARFEGERPERYRLYDAMAKHRKVCEADPWHPALDLSDLDRALRDDAFFERRRWLAALVALADLALAGALALVPVRTNAAAGWFLAGAFAALALGAWVFTAGHPDWMRPVAALALAHGAAAGAIALVRPRHPDAPPALAATLPLHAPPLVVASFLLAALAWRGPEAIHAVLVAALVDGGGPRVAIGLGLLALLALFGAAAWRAAGRAWAAPVALAAALAAPALAVALLTPAKVIRGANDALRIGPSKLGEAGTGVEEFLK